MIRPEINLGYGAGSEDHDRAILEPSAARGWLQAQGLSHEPFSTNDTIPAVRALFGDGKNDNSHRYSSEANKEEDPLALLGVHADSACDSWTELRSRVILIIYSFD